MKVAVIGATGLVGRTMCKILEERKFPITEFLPAASERSSGRVLTLNNKEYPVQTVQEVLNEEPDIALFSAGSDVSLKWAPEFTSKGIFVIDNSSAWRMDRNTPLVVPEINGNILSPDTKLIANPNCSTIQLVMILYPLHCKYGLKRVVISTYQSVTGTGAKAVEQLDNERAGVIAEKIYPHAIDLNCLPHCDVFMENGYTKEEMKLVNESRKILNLPDLGLTATAVRVPVVGGHSESVNVELRRKFDISELKDVLNNASGVTVKDDPLKEVYPMPCEARGKDDVFVGRIRKDESVENGLNLWIVADNLRKGAATNAVQIAERCLEFKA